MAAVKNALDALLTFLASPAARTDANCVAVDSFFCLPEQYGWDAAWDHMSDPRRDILADMDGALHDTISAPDIVTNFESTAEQLLERLCAVEVKGVNVPDY